MQKDLFCTPIVSLLQCKKGFFAHLKLYFGSAKSKRIRDASIYTSKKYRSSFYS